MSMNKDDLSKISSACRMFDIHMEYRIKDMMIEAYNMGMDRGSTKSPLEKGDIVLMFRRGGYQGFRGILIDILPSGSYIIDIMISFTKSTRFEIDPSVDKVIKLDDCIDSACSTKSVSSRFNVGDRVRDHNTDVSILKEGTVIEVFDTGDIKVQYEHNSGAKFHILVPKSIQCYFEVLDSTKSAKSNFKVGDKVYVTSLLRYNMVVGTVSGLRYGNAIQIDYGEGFKTYRYVTISVDEYDIVKVN